MGIKIIADASCNLFTDILKAKNLDIKVMNMHLTVGEKEYNCYDDELDIESFSHGYYTDIENGVQTRTSLIPPMDFVNEFEKQIEAGNQVICFIMAKGISGTYNSACVARDDVNEKYGKEMVYVVDSTTSGFGLGLQAMHAYELVQEGKDFDSIKEEAENFKFKVRSEFTVDNIKYLVKTGRASKALARFINLLKIKICLKNNHDESRIVFNGSVIGRKNSLKRLCKLADEKFDRNLNQTLYISHCDCLDEANYLKAQLNECGIEKVEVYQHDVVSGSHIGPRSIAIFYIAKPEEEKKSLIQRIIKRK